MLGSTPATQRYKLGPCSIKTHEVIVFCVGTKLVELYSLADCSTATGRIPILFAGGCWAWRQLPKGIKDVPVASKLRVWLTSLERVLGSLLAKLYSIAYYSTTASRIPIRFMGGCWARRQLRDGIRDVPVASEPRILLTFVEGVVGSILVELSSIADYSTTSWGIPIRFAGGCVTKGD